MRDDIKLPTTVEEFQRARREAFWVGVDRGHDMGAHAQTRTEALSDAREEARRRYPIRRKSKRIVFLPSAEKWARAREAGINLVTVEFAQDRHFHHPCSLTERALYGDDIRALADLLANPFEEIEE